MIVVPKVFVRVTGVGMAWIMGVACIVGDVTEDSFVV